MITFFFVSNAGFVLVFILLTLCDVSQERRYMPLSLDLERGKRQLDRKHLSGLPDGFQFQRPAWDGLSTGGVYIPERFQEGPVEQLGS